jgi:hypothetical protein
MSASLDDDSGLSERDLEALLLADPSGASDDDTEGEMEVADNETSLEGSLEGKLEVSEEEIIDHADLDVGDKPAKDDSEEESK